MDNELLDDEISRIESAGNALETLADLLGADGSEHHLSDGDLRGLAHAVSVIGAYLKMASIGLNELAAVNDRPVTNKRKDSRSDRVATKPAH